METRELKPIIYVSSEERADNYSWCCPESKYLNPNVDFRAIADLQTLEGKKSFPRQLEEGMVLMAHPYRPNVYIDINQAEEALFAMKMDAVEAIARWLGVKTFEATAVYRGEQERTMKIMGEVEYKVVEGAGSFSREKKEAYEKKYSRCSQYSGESQPEDVEKARQKMKEYGLENERLCQFLLEQRSGGSNSMQGFEENMTLSNELNENTEIAFSLSAMKGMLKIKSDTELTLKKKMEVALHIKVTF